MPNAERRESSIAWVLLAVVVLIVGAVEAYLVHRTHAYFGGGALNRVFALTGLAAYLAYFAEAFVYDVVFYATVGLIVLGALAKLSPLQRCYAVVVGVLSALAVIVAARWEVYSHFKAAFDIAAAWDMAEGKVTGVLAYLDAEIVLWAVLGIGYVIANLLIVRWLGRFGRSIARWRVGRRPVAALAVAWVALGVNHFATAGHESLRYGLQRKCSYACVDALLARCSDFDGDHFGPLTSPPDPDNFDPQVHPYAVDQPGNGLDEDGLAGDLPWLDPVALRGGFPRLTGSDGRNVILCMVETFRFDVLDMTIDGREVMPFLQSLAREHCRFTHAYSNYGTTTPAIIAALTGTINYDERTRSLFDQFKELGYRTCGVSAQNENWGDCYRQLRLHELDDYFDARHVDWDGQTLDTWQKLFPSALTLESRALNRHIFEIIDRDLSRPFIMYVNYQDLHYPYHHPAMSLVFIEEARRDTAFFCEQNRELILRQYANAAHHLDQSFRQLCQGLESRGLFEDTVLVIVGDHGDSFYEDGVLGHGWTQSDYQKRVPLLLVNGRGRFHNPVGQDELADMIVRSVDPATLGSRATVTDDPEKTVFLLTSKLSRPRQISLLALGGRVDFDFRTGRVAFDGRDVWHRPDSETLGGQRFERFRRLINRWETYRVARTQRQDPFWPEPALARHRPSAPPTDRPAIGR